MREGPGVRVRGRGLLEPSRGPEDGGRDPLVEVLVLLFDKVDERKSRGWIWLARCALTSTSAEPIGRPRVVVITAPGRDRGE